MVAAVKAGDEGVPMHGYADLLAGLSRALRLQDEGLPWASELANRYAQLIEEYRAHYRLDRNRDQNVS
jgi:hypothetical protein